MNKIFFKDHGFVVKEVEDAQIIPDNEDRIVIVENSEKHLYVVIDRVFKYEKTKSCIDIHLERIS